MLVLLFHELGVINVKEPLSIPVVDSRGAQQDKRVIQILPLLAVAGITAVVRTWTTGLATSLTFFPVHPGPPASGSDNTNSPRTG